MEYLLGEPADIIPRQQRARAASRAPRAA